MRFKDKNILVTGGAMGIGGATARRLATEGASVIIADTNEEFAKAKLEEIGNSGGKASFQYVDLSNPGSIEKMGKEVWDVSQLR